MLVIQIFLNNGLVLIMNEIEVSEENYNTNKSTPLVNGFEFGFGENNYINVFNQNTRYVCSHHLPGMKARIIVH